MSNIYDQHAKSFPLVSAYVIMRGKDRIGSIAFKFPKDGAMTVYCYMHIFGAPMVRGSAYGYGYDKCSAAAASAAIKVNVDDAITYKSKACATAIKKLIESLSKDDGQGWDRHAHALGFQVHQAV